MPQASESAQLDLPPPKAWRRFVPAWLRSVIWVDSARRYDAFLSYSWKSDSKVTPVIQSVLQQFLCPKYKLRAKTIFRDLSSMPAGSNLQNELFDRMDRSNHLIVLASPAAVHSAGMDMEARHWFSKDRTGQILIIVTAGEFETWEEMREKLLPPSVGDGLGGEPTWTDLRSLRTEIVSRPSGGKLREQMVEKLRQVFLRLYEPQSWEELQGEERSQRRRAWGIMSVVTSAFLVLAVVAIGFAIVAYTQKGRAEQQAAIAERNARESKAREFAAYATQSLSDDPERSILLGMHAVEATLRFGRPPVPAAEESLHQAILSSQERLNLKGHSGPVHSVAWSPDGKRLASASDDQTAKVWDTTTRQAILTLKGHTRPVRSVAWSPEGGWLATASDDHTAKVWNAATGRVVLTLKGHNDSVNSVAWSPDGRRLATASNDRTAKVWNVATGRAVLTLRGHTGAVNSVAWSSDQKRLATGSNDKTAKIWAAQGQQLLTLQGHNDAVNSVAWSPDGRRLVTGSWDMTAEVWNAATGQGMQILRGHTFSVFGVAWSPDGTRLATASQDETAKVWDAGAGGNCLPCKPQLLGCSAWLGAQTARG